MLGMVVENIICNLALYQALANPRKSVELTEFVQGIVHDETASLMREHNEVIQMQDERIAVLKAEVDHLERERVERIQGHAVEMNQLVTEQCAEVKAIYQRHSTEMKELHEQHSAEIKALRSELNQRS
jgi:hypothetical protein